MINANAINFEHIHVQPSTDLEGNIVKQLTNYDGYDASKSRSMML